MDREPHVDAASELFAPRGVANEPAGTYDSNKDGTADPVAMQGGAGLTGIDITIKGK